MKKMLFVGDAEGGLKMDDTISRQAAIDAVCMEWCNVKHQDCKHPFDVEKDDYYWCDGCETVLRTLPDLPSAEQERKTGKWVKTGQSFVYPDKFRNYMCSECGYDIEKTKYNYCPHCGAKMEVEG